MTAAWWVLTWGGRACLAIVAADLVFVGWRHWITRNHKPVVYGPAVASHPAPCECAACRADDLLALAIAVEVMAELRTEYGVADADFAQWEAELA